MKYFRKDIIKVQVVGSLYIHRLLHGKMKIKAHVSMCQDKGTCFDVPR